MKALSVRQPYAEFIANGSKTIEYRTWRTHYRGPLVIVAGVNVHDDWRCNEAAKKHPRGVAICIVDLYAIDPAIMGQFLWHLRDVIRLAPTPVKGRQSIWDLDVDLVYKIAASK